VDGHQHVHVLSEIRDVLAEVFRAEKISFTRLPSQKLSAALHPWVPEALSRFNDSVVEDSKRAAITYEEKGIKSGKSFVGLCTMGKMGSEKRILADLARASEGLKDGDWVEWMVHPGYRCTENHGDEFNASQEREMEMELLRSESLRRGIEELGFCIK